jgi:hypothetical protein
MARTIAKTNGGHFIAVSFRLPSTSIIDSKPIRVRSSSHRRQSLWRQAPATEKIALRPTPPWGEIRNRQPKKAAEVSAAFFCSVTHSPATVTYTDAHARGAEANAGARLVVIVTAPLDVLLAGSIVVRIAVALLDNHAPRSTGSVATAGVIANQVPALE